MIELNKPADVADGTQANVSPETAPIIPPLKLQPDTERSRADHFHINELLRYHDRVFVTHVYDVLCKRAPTDAELTRTLDDLRAGRRNKTEIIADLLTTQTDSPVQVAGLPSPALRRVSRWPFVGYVLRLARGLARLPVLLQHQQQFEAYALAQQQRIADYVNEVLAPVVKRHDEELPALAQLSTTIADAVESVLMLSDSLIELSSRQVEVQTQLEHLQTHFQHLQTQMQTGAVQQQQTDAQLHVDLSALTEALTVQQQRHDELRQEHAANSNAQQEFLVQEQRVIVETQKVVLGEFAAQLRELEAEQERTRAELAAEVHRLRLMVEALRAPAPVPAAEQPVAPDRKQA
ncbi:MAG: hypothetical protein ACJ74W_20250 [Pyrinomonadaceae bacterium]